MKKFITLGFLGLALSACQTTVKGNTPDVTVKGDGYSVEVGDDGHSGHCPPGHAKKDWC